MSKSFPLNVWNGIKHGSYMVIAQEAKPSDISLRRWIAVYAVYKLGKDPFSTATLYSFLKSCLGSRYCIVDFEVRIETLEISDGINEEDLVNISFSSVMTDEELIVNLTNNDIDMSRFVPEWKCDFPL